MLLLWFIVLEYTFESFFLKVAEKESPLQFEMRLQDELSRTLRLHYPGPGYINLKNYLSITRYQAI